MLVFEIRMSLALHSLPPLDREQRRHCVGILQFILEVSAYSYIRTVI